MTFTLALGGIALIGVLGAAALRPSSFASFCLAAYLLSAATIVLLTEVLSPIRLVGAGAYAVGEVVVLAVALVVWNARGRALPPRVRFRAVLTHPILLALAVVVGLGVCYELFLALATPPNNGDSLTYHLTRAAAWLQHGGIYRIPGPASSPENDYPANAEIEILFSFAFLHRDTAAALTQFLAQGVATVAVYGTARRLAFDPPASLFAALLVPTLSQVALQSVTTQNDLVAGALVATAAYFLHVRDRIDPWLAGLALGLALGTKFTVLFALPALALIAAASLRRRALETAAVAAIVGFTVVGSSTYVRNQTEAGTPLGRLTGDPGLQRPVVTARGTVSTVARDVYGLIDLPGFPLDYRDLRVPTAVARKFFTGLGIAQNPPESTGYPFGFAINVRANEDLAFFGPLGILLVLPLPLAYALRWARPERAAHAAALPLYLLALRSATATAVRGGS